jgi:hypothetical protein
MFFASTTPNPTGSRPRRAEPFRLWIDQVGVFTVFAQERIEIGGPASTENQADLVLGANLSRRHAAILRCEEHFVLEAFGPAAVDGNPVTDRALLRDGSRVTLGRTVEWVFRIPSVLSQSARIEFESSHRPQQPTDAVILMDETCVLGPHPDSHIRCHHWREPVLIFRRGAELWCKSRERLDVDGNPMASATELQANCTISGPELQFRVEVGREAQI